MRYIPSIALLALTAASTALAAPAPAPPPSKVDDLVTGGKNGILGLLGKTNDMDLNGVDRTVAGVDTPKNMMLDCGGPEPGLCSRFLNIIRGADQADGIDDVGNGAIMHGINEFEGHLGKQEGHITDTSVRYFSLLALRLG